LTMAKTLDDYKNDILERATALGNSHYGFKEICSDLLNGYHGDMKTLEAGTFLCRQTLERLKSLTATETGEPYRPNADTCERVLRFFGAQAHFTTVTINRRYRNKPKHDD